MQLSLSKEAIFNKNTPNKVLHTSMYVINDNSLYILCMYVCILNVCMRVGTYAHQGGRLTTLNFRPGAVTSLNFFHVLIFFSTRM